MLKHNGSTDTQSDREIVITRVFNAPRELVFKAWTEPKHILQWWGPEGFTTRVTELDLRPGGRWCYVMVGPDGTEYPVKGIFREIVPPERIVTSNEFDEGFDKVVNADLPQGIVMTAVFEELDGKTKLTLQIVHATGDDCRKHEEMGVVAGWNSSFDCLDEFLAKQVAHQKDDLTVTLPSDREIVVTRVFDAPRGLMFKVWTQPEHFARWLGPKDFTTTFCEMDVRLGGTYRACIRSPEGKDHWMQGIYREIVEPEHLVFTFAWEDEDGKPKHETLVAVTFLEHDGKTKLTFHQAMFESVEGRNSHLEGWSECLDRLEEYLVNVMAGET